MSVFQAVIVGALCGAVFCFVICTLYFLGRERSELLRLTADLRNALAHSSIRGQWGERMVEDILLPAGFQEGINYLKQYTGGASGTRPDYCFLLPRNLKVYLDSKFPLNNYLNLHETESKVEQLEFKKRFLRDAKQRIKEVTGRDYINPDDGTVDFVLVFIPNEQVYSFIHLHEPSLFDDALKNKVILCSPWTLYPVLSIIRLAIDNFILEKNTGDLLDLLRSFEKQWNAFNSSFEKMGQRLSDTQAEFDQLTKTRKNQLDKILKRMDTLRQHSDYHDGMGSIQAMEDSTQKHP